MKNNKLIIANWKMNPASLEEAEKLLKEVSNFPLKARSAPGGKIHDSRFMIHNSKCDLVICPPFIYLESLSKSFKIQDSPPKADPPLAESFKIHDSPPKADPPLAESFKLGAQDCFWENQGAYTGEISPLMLKNLGVEYVIIGHSERRNYLGETDEMINKKILAALKAGLKVVLCVGETAKQREKGSQKNIVQEQLQRDLVYLTQNSKLKTQNFIIAYEPVWAIGTGNYCQPQDAVEMIKFIKSLVISHLSFVVPVLYGGSVNSKNIADYLKYPEIDGVLVGGASVKINEFKKIINEVSPAIKTGPAQK